MRKLSPELMSRFRCLAGALLLAMSLGEVAKAQESAERPLELRALLLLSQSRFADAEVVIQDLLARQTARLGADATPLAKTLNMLGVTQRRLGNNKAARGALERALQIRERNLPPDHADLAVTLTNLGAVYKALDRPADAEAAYVRALAIRDDAPDPDPTQLGLILNELGLTLFRQGKFGAAEARQRRSLALREAALGPAHKDVAASRNNLAATLTEQGRFEEAEALLTASVEAMEAAFGPAHPTLVAPLNNLGNLHMERGLLARAEPFYARTGAIVRDSFGTDHPIHASYQIGLAGVFGEYARIEDAAQMYREAIGVYERALGPDSLQVAGAINNFATTYVSHGRYDEAQPLLERAREIYETTLGPNHPDVSIPLANLGFIRAEQQEYGAANFFYGKALEIREAAYGPTHPQVASALRDLGLTALEQDDLATAEDYLTRAQSVFKATVGAESPLLSTTILGLARLRAAQGKFDAAERLFQRALALTRETFGDDHPNVARALSRMAEAYVAQGKPEIGLRAARAATAVMRGRAGRMRSSRSRAAQNELTAARDLFATHVAAIADRPPDDDGDATPLIAEAFEVAQLARASKASTAVAAMAARFAAGDDALARAVRERQDTLAFWRNVDRRLIEALSREGVERDLPLETRLRERRDALLAQLTAQDRALATAFPAYVELTGAEPLDPAGVQALLDQDEALMSLFVTPDATYVWLVRRRGVFMFRAEIDEADIVEMVATIRETVDPFEVARTGVLPTFAVREAHALYRRIFAPAEAELSGIRHLFVVPDGALQSLPLGVLITEPPDESVDGLADYRDLAWLATRRATTVLPSVASLRALRRFVQRSRAKRPFIGYGDPNLSGDAGSTRGIEVRALFTRGGYANVDVLRQLSPLPDTADELRALARTMGAAEGALRLGAAATESSVRSDPLADYRIVAFATHGLAAGDFDDVSEPALVLTPPDQASLADDGLLTASEITQLPLDADWVILSACNTAAPDGTPGAEGLSGLAKAFFFAGTRSLLVSHWPVASDATRELTTTMLSEAMGDESVGRAEALRRSILRLMSLESRPEYAHPLFWAPFVVVGEGGAASG